MHTICLVNSNYPTPIPSRHKELYQPCWKLHWSKWHYSQKSIKQSIICDLSVSGTTRLEEEASHHTDFKYKESTELSISASHGRLWSWPARKYSKLWSAWPLVPDGLCDLHPNNWYFHSSHQVELKNAAQQGFIPLNATSLVTFLLVKKKITLCVHTHFLLPGER